MKNIRKILYLLSAVLISPLFLGAVNSATAASNVNTHTYSLDSAPGDIAIDGSGNVWVVNSGNGTAGTAAGDSNVTELSSTGALIGTYAAGTSPAGIAIDGSGNVWVVNSGNGITAGIAPGDSNGNGT